MFAFKKLGQIAVPFPVSLIRLCLPSLHAVFTGIPFTFVVYIVGSQNFDLDLKDEDLTQDLTLEMTAINTSGESAIDTIFLRGQLLL